MKKIATLTTLSLSILLAACGGGGGSGTQTSSTSMTVAPSLGQFSLGTSVRALRPDSSVLATGTIGADGKVTLTFTSYSGPVMIEVMGGTNVTYYDEGAKTSKPFPSTSTLKAVLPAPQAEVGVTALTSAAAAKVALTANTSAADINLANTKVAAAFGYADGSSILQAPKLVSATTPANTLDVAAPGDKYALILAALAKTATGTKTAADVADSLADDLRDDDELDGKRSAVTLTTAYTANTMAATLAAKYTEAATDLATQTSQTVIASTPPTVKTNVTAVVTVSNASDLSLAKAMFADLRTTVSSLSNSTKTGFLDTQATRMSDDLKANVAPDLTRTGNRISAIMNAMQFHTDATSNPSSLPTGLHPITGTQTTVRSWGSVDSAIYGWNHYSYCAKDSATKITCAVSAPPDNLIFTTGATVPKVKMMVIELTATAANQYDYTATPYTMQPTWNAQNWTNVAVFPLTISTGIPAGSGKVTQAVSGTQVTGFNLNGTLPPSTLSTGVDTVALSVARSATALSGSTYRYTLSGSVAAMKTGTTNTTSLSFDNGSYLDLDESTMNTTGPKLVGAKMIGTAQTAASKFTGSLDATAFMSNADGMYYQPTNLVFSGSISDTSASGAGEILTGKLEAAISNYHLYKSTLAESPTNYTQATGTFTGTVQAPSRPLLTLVVAANRTGVNTTAVTLNYSYGTISITGSGTTNGATVTTPANNTLTLSNQAGVQISVTNPGATTVSKSGIKLADIANGTVSYIDGTSESIQ